MGYVMQKYEETGEYHLYKAHYDENKNVVIDEETPLCGNIDVSYSRRVSLVFVPNPVKDEDEMAQVCAKQKMSVRHLICANCVGRFYKTH